MEKRNEKESSIQGEGRGCYIKYTLHKYIRIEEESSISEEAEATAAAFASDNPSGFSVVDSLIYSISRKTYEGIDSLVAFYY